MIKILFSFSSYVFQLHFQSHNLKVCVLEQKFCKSNYLFLHLSENILLHSLLLNNKLRAFTEREKSLKTKIYITLHVRKDITEDCYVRAMRFLKDLSSHAN